MTLNDIIVSALAQLDRAHDAATVETYRRRMTQYANDAQDDLAWSLALTRTEGVVPVGGEIDLSSLARPCTRVEKIEQMGHSVPFRAGETPNRVLVPYSSSAEVTYRFMPARLEHTDDVSELNEALHPLIVSYVVARERMGGDVATQGGGNIYLSMYNAAKARLRGYLTSGDAFRITGRY